MARIAPHRFRSAIASVAGFLLAILLLPSAAHAAAKAPLGGGSPLFTDSGFRCTAAFAATGGSTGYLIAGRSCGQPGETVYSGAHVLVGVIGPVQTPANGVLVVRVTNTTDWQLVPQVPTGSGGTITITGSAEAPVGASVCRAGRTTGWHCGTIVAKNQTVTFPEGTISGLTRTNVCAEPGDAGGPFISGSQAQGVLVGGSGNCSSGGVTYFKPINPILAAYGLTLLTG
ncbi:S1 family peptidase [Amycolatopsis nigrescens]|uniref:S1 family peptidase n=1 Tax=Amycolatopsis nigrescens TaxID=381445 RepID=UPI000372D5BB|nr:S1 family peptidase [Amycolatopsis nigrescens]